MADFAYCPRILDRQFNEVGRIVPIKMNVQLKRKPPSTATITLDEDAPACPVGTLLRILTPQGDAGIFYVKSIKSDLLGNHQRVLSCEHSFGALTDLVVWGKVTPSKIEGHSCTEASALKTVKYLLDRSQQDTGDALMMWSLDEIDFAFNTGDDQETQGWNFNNQTLNDCLKDVTDCLEKPEWRFTFANGHGVLHLVHQDTAVSCELRASRNLKSMQVTVDRKGMFNRCYPIGKKDRNITSVANRTDGYIVHTSGKAYADNTDSITRWGLVESVQSNTSISNAKTLCQWAFQELKRNGEPLISISVDALELSRETGVDLDRLSVGRLCRIPLPSYGITYEQVITSVSWADMVADPMSIKLTISNERPDLRDIIYKTSGGGGGKKKDAENESDHCDLADGNNIIDSINNATDPSKVISAGKLDVNDITCGTVDADEFNGGAFRGTFYDGYGSGATTLNTHHHKLEGSVGTDGKVTLSIVDVIGDDASGNSYSFNMAATKAFEDLVAAMMEEFGTDREYLSETKEIKLTIDTTFRSGRTATGTYYIDVSDIVGGNATLTIDGVEQNPGTYTLKKTTGSNAAYVGRLDANMEMWLRDSDGNLAGRFMQSANYNRYIYRAENRATYSEVEDVDVVFTKE